MKVTTRTTRLALTFLSTLFVAGSIGVALASAACGPGKPPMTPDTPAMGASPEGGTDSPPTQLPGAASSPH